VVKMFGRHDVARDFCGGVYFEMIEDDRMISVTGYERAKPAKRCEPQFVVIPEFVDASEWRFRIRDEVSPPLDVKTVSTRALTERFPAPSKK
jgi:hypothetical protein